MKKWLQVIISLVMVLSMVMGTTTALAKTEENVAVILETPIQDGFSTELSASVLREDPGQCALAACLMLLDIMSNEEIDASSLLECETMWVATLDDTIHYIYLTTDELHLAEYTPNVFAAYAWTSLDDADADAMQIVLEEKLASGEYDSLHFCTTDEISAVPSALEKIQNN